MSQLGCQFRGCGQYLGHFFHVIHSNKLGDLMPNMYWAKMGFYQSKWQKSPNPKHIPNQFAELVRISYVE